MKAIVTIAKQFSTITTNDFANDTLPFKISDNLFIHSVKN